MSEHHLRDEAAHLAEEVVHEAEAEVRGTAALLKGDQAPNLLDAMGGPLGMAESGMPVVSFVIATTAGAETKTAAIIAVAVALVAALARLARRQTPQFAIAGLVGVGISAWIASRTGDARTFYLPSLLINVGYGSACLISIAVGRPLIGFFVAGIEPWWKDPHQLRTFRTATFMWVALFVLRLVVQVPLYLAKSATILGTVKLAMGYPLFGVWIWLTWLLLRRAGIVGGAPTDAPETSDSEPAPAAAVAAAEAAPGEER